MSIIQKKKWLKKGCGEHAILLLRSFVYARHKNKFLSLKVDLLHRGGRRKLINEDMSHNFSVQELSRSMQWRIELWFFRFVMDFVQQEER